ncbi:HYC_CC_PP family protein [Chitinophaga cymbidii]|uniref:Uncharacterized protein n=1 Tax=Chitinophaga cymbidii TaxID=1096750 RepID=A0A512RS66_9BACT|nr:hypothetical protein [Chitinophaga cymbidii]GEP98537.1 hypothetical protein CCY01nite_47970 [Chitinophaga cymbidii]
MKRILTLILALLYMGTSTGATFHMHYCMGKLVDVKFWEHEAQKCSKCGSEENSVCAKKCCKDIHKTVKFEKDQKVSESVFQFMQLAAIATPISYIDIPKVFPTSVAVEYPTGHAPPRSSKVPARIFYCTFRI